MHRQGTRDTTAIGIGTLAHTNRGLRTLIQWRWELGNSGTYRIGCYGDREAQCHRDRGHWYTCRRGTEDPDAIWMGTRNPNTHRRGSSDLHAVGMGTWHMQAGI